MQGGKEPRNKIQGGAAARRAESGEGVTGVVLGVTGIKRGGSSNGVGKEGDAILHPYDMRGLVV